MRWPCRLGSVFEETRAAEAGNTEPPGQLVDRITDTTHAIQALNLSIPLASNMEDFIRLAMEPALDAVVNDAPLRLGGGKPLS